MALAFPPHAIQAILEIAEKIKNNSGNNLNNSLISSPPIDEDDVDISNEYKQTKLTTTVKIDDEYTPPLWGLESSFTPIRNANAQLFRTVLEQPIIDIDRLRSLSWTGVPPEYRPLVWKLLLNYLPLEKKLHNKILFDKRNQYLQLVNKFYHAEMTAEDKALLNQVRLDVPRTIPRGFGQTPLFKSTILHKVLERILFVWSQSNPLISYFQGLNDIPAMFLLVFLSQYIEPRGSINDLTNDILDKVEADTFWCLSLLMNNLKKRFINFHDGINRMAMKLEKLVKLKEPGLSDHLQTEGCDFILFSLRWMICLLSREFEYSLCTRLWDSYISHGPNFGYFHIYVCAALITTKEWVPSLLKKEFSDLIVFLQRLPTDNWTIHHIDYLLVGAYQIFLLEIQSAVRESASKLFNFVSNNNNNNNIHNNSLQQQCNLQFNSSNSPFILENQLQNIYQMFLQNQQQQQQSEQQLNISSEQPEQTLQIEQQSLSSLLNNCSNNSNIQNQIVNRLNNINHQNNNNNNIINNNSNNSTPELSRYNQQQQEINQQQQHINLNGIIGELPFLSIDDQLKNKLLEFIPRSNFNFSQITSETADEELVKQVTFHLLVIVGALLFVGIILLVIIICTCLTIISLEYYNSN